MTIPAYVRAPQPSLAILLIQLLAVVSSSLACSIWGTLALPLCSVTHTPLSQAPSSPHAPVQPGWSDSAVLTTFKTLSGFTSWSESLSVVSWQVGCVPCQPVSGSQTGGAFSVCNVVGQGTGKWEEGSSETDSQLSVHFLLTIPSHMHVFGTKG